MYTNFATKKYINVESTSLQAVTMGPDATAGSTPTRAKKRGDKLPRRVAVMQAPKTPQLTMMPTITGSLPT
jgi:hypothetical protein